MSKVVWLGVGGYFACTLLAFLKVNRAEPEQIFDESAHIPQCQKWCKGNYQWDDRITTLPGLYIIAGGVLKTLEWFGYLIDPCTTFNLRMVNLLINTLSVYICYLIVKMKFPDISDGKKMASALVCASTPLLWFYSFMFYTEPPATLFLLLMHYFWMKKAYSWSAFMGAWAVFCRQTNIVWVLMHGLMTFTSVLENHTQFFFSLQRCFTAGGKKRVFNVKMFKTPEVNSCLVDRNQNNQKKSKALPLEIKDDDKKSAQPSLFVICGQGVALTAELVRKCLGYLMAGLSFSYFVIVNRGIVIGDRDAHEVTVNSPQILYFSLFVGILSLPSFFGEKGKKARHFIERNVCTTLGVYGVFYSLVHYNTVAHRYNLWDPSHITHYFLNSVYYEPNTFRYYLLPFYTLCWTFICTNLAERVGKVRTAFFVLTTCLNLIPHLLLEFRYYVPAYLFFRLNIRVNSWKVLVGELFISNFFNMVALGTLAFRLVQFPPPTKLYMLIW